MSVYDHINSWKNEKIFQKQKELNMNEISDKINYPVHWNNIINGLNKIEKKDSIIDIGCGCGTVKILIELESPGTKYFGVDYSEDAIKMAKKDYGESFFDVKDVNSLSKKDVENFDVALMNGLLCMLPNADEVLESFLKLDLPNIIISRIKFTDRPSYYKIYSAYDLIETYDFFHNLNHFNMIIQKSNYEKFLCGNDTILLKKK